MQVFRARIFGGGRNTQKSPYDVTGDESPDDLNLDGQVLGAVRKRFGIRKFSSTVYGADPIGGLGRFYRADGEKYLMVLCGTQLWSGRGSPPDNTVIKTDVTPNTYMTFATMQDRVYCANYDDDIVRYDGDTVQTIGLPAPEADVLGLTVANTTNGRMDDGEYVYRFRFRYGGLGRSNLSNDEDSVMPWISQTAAISGGSDTVNIFGLGSLRPDATLEQPSHIQIYRTIARTAAEISDCVLDASGDCYRRFAYYFVDEVAFPSSGSLTYVDEKADVELVTIYEGDTFPEPGCSYIAEHRNRMFFGRCRVTGESDPGPDFKSRVYWSDLYQPDRVLGFADVFPEDGDEITGLTSYQNSLLIFKRAKVYMLLGSSPANFEIRLVNNFSGCVAPRSITAMDNRVFFLSHDGVYVFDGSSFQRISDPVRPDILSISDEGREFAAAGAKDGRFYIGYEEG
jgi:hypothetical protein